MRLLATALLSAATIAHAQLVTFTGGTVLRDAGGAVTGYTEAGITITGPLLLGDVNGDGAQDLAFNRGSPSYFFSGFDPVSTATRGLEITIISFAEASGVTRLVGRRSGATGTIGGIQFGSTFEGASRTFGVSWNGDAMEWTQEASFCPEGSPCQFGGYAAISAIRFGDASLVSEAPSFPDPGIGGGTCQLPLSARIARMAGL